MFLTRFTRPNTAPGHRTRFAGVPSAALLGVALLTPLLPALNDTAEAKGPPTFPNSTRYRDTGAKPATGRSGSATLTTRALLNSDGSTDVEVTTGKLDSAEVAPGNLSSVHIKGIGSDGVAYYTKNFNGLKNGGYGLFNLKDFTRAQPLQVQGNVRGIDRRRTDVVTTSTAVKLRPDLQASNLTAPESGIVNTPVNISLTIREGNLDVGAATNAVLYVDGVEVDRVNGLWVDAGGNVSAVFTYQFTTIGVKQLEVKLENIAPGDYDSSNNSVSGQIEIVTPGEPLSYLAHAGESFYRYYYANGGRSGSDDNDGAEWRNSDTYENRDHHVDLRFSSPKKMAFPLATVSVSETSDGTPVASVRHDNVEASWTYSDTNDWYSVELSGADLWDEATNSYLYLNSYTYTYADNSVDEGTSGNYRRFSGEALYQSAGYSTTWTGDRSNVTYSYVYNNTTKGGTFSPWGNQLGIAVSITDSTATTLAASVLIDLDQTASSEDIQPRTYYYDGDYSSWYEYETITSSRWGSVRE